MSLFTVKYAPKTSEQVIGNDLQVQKLKNFIVNFKSMPNNAILIHGPIGTGKTCSVQALAKELDLDLLELNSSDLRNKDAMGQFLRSTIGQQSLFFKKKVILIDEIDNFSGMKDRGGLQELAKAIDKTSFPLILTANDITGSKFKTVSKKSLKIEYYKINHKDIFDFFKTICDNEGVGYNEKALKSLARQADGDLRSSLIDLQTVVEKRRNNGVIEFDDVVGLSDRKRTDTILNALNIVFKSSSAENSLRAFDDVGLDSDNIFLWLDENLPKEYLSAKSLAKAYESLSRADIFRNRIRRRQHWRFLVYVYNLLSAGVSSSKEERNKEVINYRRPMRLLNIWQAKMRNAKKKEIAKKLAEATHSSIKDSTQRIHYLQQIFKNGGGKEIAEELELTLEETEWLKRKI